MSQIKAISDIREIARNAGLFVDIWSDEDIADRIEAAEYQPTPERIDAVKAIMRRRMDATIGINWIFVDACIDDAADEWGDSDLPVDPIE